MEKEFTLKITSAVKGIAILMMLLHHLYYKNLDSGLYYVLAQYGKVCVGVFIFLSGFGLVRSGEVNLEGERSLLSFYWHRLFKLFFNYWLILLIFVPIGIWGFQRSIPSCFPNMEHPYWGFFLQCFALHRFVGEYGYNATWWFMSVILLLYVIAPFLYKGLKVSFFLGLLFLLVYSVISTFGFFNEINPWVVDFCVGMLIAEKKYDILLAKKFSPQYLLFGSVLLVFLLFYVREFVGLTFKQQWLIDSISAFSYCVFAMSCPCSKIKNCFAFLGKHSMNMFLTHTFLYGYFFKDFFYFYKIPIINYMNLVICSLMLSVVLEYMKNRVGFYVFLRWVLRQNPFKG